LDVRETIIEDERKVVLANRPERHGELDVSHAAGITVGPL